VAKRTNRGAWVLTGVLAVVLLVAGGLMSIWLRPYWVASERGYLANLQRAALPGAPLANADLRGAQLRRANLRGAILRGAYLKGSRGARPEGLFC
jgi:pentapeptide repeat protein